MKRLSLIILATLIISGCTTKVNEDNITSEDKSYYADGLITEKSYKEIEERFGLFPSSIYIDANHTKIGWVFEGGMYGCLCEDDSNQLFRFNEIGQGFNFYDPSLEVMNQEYATLYYGSLEKIDEYIYSVRGEFCPYYENMNKDMTITEDIDFYIVLKDGKLIVVLENINLDELKKLETDSYYIEVASE